MITSDKHARAPGHRAAVAAGLTHDGSGFAGDGRFVHGRGTLDDLAVTRDNLSSLNNNEISLTQLL